MRHSILASDFIIRRALLRNNRRGQSVSESGVDVARKLIGRRQLERGGGAPSAHAAADACGQLYRELSRWVGSDGCHALFARALAEARSSNPALIKIQLHARSDPYVQGLAESITAHGEPATVTGLESLLAVLIDLLRRLIGNEVAAKLIERSLASIGGKTAAITDRKQEEA